MLNQSVTENFTVCGFKEIFEYLIKNGKQVYGAENILANDEIDKDEIGLVVLKEMLEEFNADGPNEARWAYF